MSRFALRDYQTEAIEAIEGYWDDNPLLNCGVSLPTGAGKTVIMSELARRAVARGERVAIIVHRHELVEQTLAKLRDADPLMFLGTVKANRDETAAEVVVCSVQTLARPGRAERVLPRDVVIYDEAHGSASDSAVEVMRRLDTLGGPTKAVGFSATFYRADRKPLDIIWDDIVYEKDILWAVRQGFLSDATGISVPIQGLDLDAVKVSGGDYQDRDLGQQMLNAHAADQIAKAYLEHAADRKAICFAPTVAAATEISLVLNRVGIPAETVTGKTPAGERREMYARLRSGETRVLSSVAVLTEGFDEPSVDCVIMARPTKSQGLYVQCVGRGLRLSPGKDDCLILDVSGTADSQSLIAMPDLAGKPKKDAADMTLKQLAGEAPERGPQGLRANLRAVGEFDPFARQRFPWLTTHGGKRFVVVGNNRVVFLMPDADGVLIGVSNTYAGRRNGKWLTDSPVPEVFATSLAERFAEEMGAEKRRKYPDMSPSVAQIGYASTLGIENPETMSRADLSKAIDVAKASLVLD